MKILLSARARRRGMTYATVVIAMITIGTMLAAYLKLVSVQNQLVVRSQTWNRAVPILESGVEEAIAHLNKNGSPDSGGTVDLAKMNTDGWYNNGSVTGPWYKFGWLNGDFYFVSISSWNGSTAYMPMINSTGWVRQLPSWSMRHLKGSAGPMLAQNDGLSFVGYSRRMATCSTTNNPVFNKGLIARHGIDMNGNNVTVDSYDSSNPSLSTNGRWDVSKRRDRGDVASNDTLTNIISVGNANIWGRLSTGPGGSASIGPNGKVGDAAWQLGSVNGIKPGYFTDDMNVEFPDVVLPVGSAGWLPPPSTTVGSGDYYIGGTWTTSLTVADGANVRLRIDGGVNYTGSDAFIIGSNANVKIYLNCPSAKFAGNGIVNNRGTPNQCQIYGTSVLTDLALSGNGETTCVVYAPYANVKLNGGGSGDNDFSGALVAKTFTFNGHYKLHYDEALGRVGHWRGFTITSWNER
jgi:hypothetical protein